ncbi:MAG: MgtC/SapB family protein [Phycisphaerales bacterium]|nr:MgtC/SapB family protein [Phycisphaerales bacterium]
MTGLQLTLEWSDIAWRLGAAAVAGILIGLNRGEHGKAAGLRTTLLVILAAAIAMILGNSLITTHGKANDSFVQLDMMRLPLGILTGIGFIGAGTILKKSDLIIGVTTAATIWYVSVLGLCFGAGAFHLGAVGTVLGLVTLAGLTWIERIVKQKHRAVLDVATESSDAHPLIPTEDELRAIIESENRRIASCDIAIERLSGQCFRRTFTFELHWQARRHQNPTPTFLTSLESYRNVTRVTWRVIPTSG